MKRLLCALLLMSAGLAAADELGDANKFLLAKQYDKALPIYTKLANAGNAEAQFHLGEMYWFGDGTRADLAKAAELFGKSAAAGNTDARESLAALKRRETHGADITYWTTSYNGQDLVSGNFDCKAPDLPALSKTNDEINKLSKDIEDWKACYNRFVLNVKANMPPLKRIPADVADMMTPAEVEQAGKHLDEVYAKVVGGAQATAAAALTRQDQWRAATKQFVDAQNAEMAKRNKLDKEMIEEQQRHMEEATPRGVRL